MSEDGVNDGQASGPLDGAGDGPEGEVVPAAVATGGRVEPVVIEDEMRASYLDYAMSVIVGRALPDVRDGRCVGRRGP